MLQELHNMTLFILFVEAFLSPVDVMIQKVLFNNLLYGRRYTYELFISHPFKRGFHAGINFQSQLGHASPTVTLNIYAHLMKPVNQEAACRLENTIFQTTGSKMVAGNKKEVTL